MTPGLPHQNIDVQHKASNYEETIRQLDIYYGIVKRQLLNYQSAITGLFPEISTDNIHGNVRESVYCATAIWSLYQAYRRIDDDRGKSYELGQAAVKCMRGILKCWVMQAPKIELFKKNQCNAHALHCKFHLLTGDQVCPDTYPHLQIDVISLYLLYLVQMITSGLQIIYTEDEVAFVQNLVYYVERAYRTPDYGMWERGTKYNDGTPEIHARFVTLSYAQGGSGLWPFERFNAALANYIKNSIGMAKAALEAINGCNLFGEQGASWSVIYVDIDAHNRNRSIFETMLPRESSSKEVDAALLPTISFPAFATHEKSLLIETKENIVSKLKGDYGFIRFPRDGFGSVLEDKSRMFYREGETKEFENIECEWPIFYIFMVIDGVFKNLPDQVEEYQNLLKARMKTNKFGDPVVPMYFYVPAENTDDERNEPGSSVRRMSNEGSPTGGLYLLAQALFVIAQLLTGGLLHINELDPIRRYLPSYNRPRKGGRYSAFQGTATDLVVQIVMIAESSRLQAMMATYGIQTQTPHQVEPVQIWSSAQLVKVYQQLGVNAKLHLQGRPPRPVGALGTSKVYRVCGMTVLCYPLVFEVSEFYLYRDMALLIDDIKAELQFVGRFWRLSGRPTVCLLIREEHMRDPQFKEMLDLMAMLKKGNCEGTKVRIGRIQNLISSSCMEHLDFMNHLDLSDLEFTAFKQLEHDYIGYQSLTDVPRARSYPDLEGLSNGAVAHYMTMSLPDLVEALRGAADLCERSQVLEALLRRQGRACDVNGNSVEDLIRVVYSQAGQQHCWHVVRYCSSLLKHTVDSISPFITAVLVNGKQLTVGVVGHEETVFDKPMIPAEIHSVMYTRLQPHDVIQAVLQQEVVLYCGRLITTQPQVFKGILKIRIGWVLEAMKLYQRMQDPDAAPIECYSPFKVRQLLHKVLTVKDWATTEKLTTFQRRQIEGCLCRVPPGFYDQVWDVLSRTRYGIRVGNYQLPQQPTLSNMTRSELNFALLVEEMLMHIALPEYRQIIVELLNIVSTILNRNRELMFQTQLDLDLLVSEAVSMFVKDNFKDHADDKKRFFGAAYSVTTGYLARAVVNNVLQGCQLLTASDWDEDNDPAEPCRVS